MTVNDGADNWTTPCRSRDLAKSRGLPSLGLALVVIILLGICSQSYAVNYDDPNLSGRRDIVAKAALRCNHVRDLATEFKNCLADNDVTDQNEIVEALATLRLTPQKVERIDSKATR